MQKLIQYVVWILLFPLVLVTLFFAFYVTILETLSSLSSINPPNLRLLPTIAISSGVLIGILTWFREKSKLRAEKDRHTSEVMLKEVKKGFKATVLLLSDMNNNRETWIRAARTLLKSLALKKSIVSKEYLKAYALEEERTRNALYEILSLKNGSTGARNALPAQFFYGIEDWRKDHSLDDVRKESIPKPVVSNFNLDTISPNPVNKRLDRESVVAIFQFIEYPNDYADPLDQIKIWEDRDNMLRRCRGHVDEGARKYIVHRNCLMS